MYHLQRKSNPVASDLNCLRVILKASAQPGSGHSDTVKADQETCCFRLQRVTAGEERSHSF